MIRNDLLQNNPLRIVDIGASGGIDPRWEKFSDYFIATLFEPDPREYETLKSKCKKNAIVLNSALSDSIKDIEFHLCRKQQVSSVFLPNYNFLKKFPDVERFDVLKTIKIKVDTLDNQLKKNNMTDVDLIKIDTQGYELNILKGSTDALEKVIGLEIEVEFVPLYEKQPLFNEVDNYINKFGFELFDLKRYFWKRNCGQNFGNRKGQLVFGEALYFKNPEQILLMSEISEDKIIRSICIYLIYAYPDLAQILFKLAKKEGLLSKKISDLVTIILSKFRDKNPIPDFRGKGIIEHYLQVVTNIFSNKGPFTGADKVLGNKL